MKSSIQSKGIFFLLLSIIAVFLAFTPLEASSDIAALEHKKLMAEYIADIRTLQDHILSLFENVASMPTKDSINLSSQINSFYKKIEDVEKKLLNYASKIPKLSPERRDLLLALVALNSVENSLYQLTQFIRETSQVERALLLEDFYFLRTSAIDTLNKLENIILRE
jgi:hypothetical protein